MNTAINLLSVIPMRKEASHRSEMVSQLLFGEYVEIFEEEKDFIRVKCLYDDYEGWVQANQLTNANEKFDKTNEFTCTYIQKVSVNGKSIRIPYSSPVYSSFVVAGNEINYLLGPGEIWKNAEYILSEENLETIYNFYLNTPYLWGGKSIFGIDCSGFVQQVFKMFGIKLLRDAYLQAEQGTAVENIEEVKLGDLAFFQNENGRVTHVGIALENGKIVHASGNVRIDTIDKEGIMNVETGKRTHELHSIRRIV